MIRLVITCALLFLNIGADAYAEKKMKVYVDPTSGAVHFKMTNGSVLTLGGAWNSGDPWSLGNFSEDQIARTPEEFYSDKPVETGDLGVVEIDGAFEDRSGNLLVRFHFIDKDGWGRGNANPSFFGVNLWFWGRKEGLHQLPHEYESTRSYQDGKIVLHGEDHLVRNVSQVTVLEGKNEVQLFAVSPEEKLALQTAIRQRQIPLHPLPAIPVVWHAYKVRNGETVIYVTGLKFGWLGKDARVFIGKKGKPLEEFQVLNADSWRDGGTVDIKLDNNDFIRFAQKRFPRRPGEDSFWRRNKSDTVYLDEIEHPDISTLGIEGFDQPAPKLFTPADLFECGNALEPKTTTPAQLGFFHRLLSLFH